ncbi:hypothetical protein [Nocardioides lacusdianchii]|uniref:hypothetical protein n=1 Tax=Nocardioides lacusdianchii TaxID=2783664 RepID=UPI001CCC01AD|nr:hypothetical protein [Nocardioides lacusdianchii]
MTENPQPTTRTWRDRLPRRLPSGRKAVAAGAVVAALALGGAGFGAGYAVADSGSSDTATTQTTDVWGDRGFPGDGAGRGPMGEVPGGGMGDQAPDLDGDGQPDTDSSDSSSQNS